MTKTKADLIVLEAFAENVSSILGLPVSYVSCDISDFEGDDNLQLEIKDGMCIIRVKKEKINVPEFIDVAFKLRSIWQTLNEKNCDDIADQYLTGKRIDAIAFTDLMLKGVFKAKINWRVPKVTMDCILQREVVIANELQDKVMKENK